MARGIDYGGGLSNRDPANGIRYGVINMNSLAHWAWESVEDDYGPATCPKCGNEAVEYDGDKHGEYGGHGSDYACENCEYGFMSDEAYGEQPVGRSIQDGPLMVEVGVNDGDCFVVRSEFKTRAGFCSPCAPGACHLKDACEDGEWCYCFGHDWFEDGRAPYRVFRVSDGFEIKPEGK